MRIVYVLTSLGMGGAERQALAIASRMAVRGHTVALMILRPQLTEEWPTPLPTIHLDLRKNPVSLFAALLRARRFLHDFRPDLLHSHSFHANLFARLLRVLIASQVLSTVHNIYEGGRIRMIAYRLTDFLSTGTTAVSAAAAQRFVNLKAVPQHKCVTLTNAIDTFEFSPSPERRLQTRAAMSINVEFIWLAAGRIVPAKDYPNLLRAFAIVRATHPATQLWIAGDSSCPESDHLQALAQELRIDSSTRYLGLCRDLAALLDAADAFVLSSAWEGMPLVLGEAMSMEKPIVATDVGGVRELVGETGTLVPAKTPENLAGAMLYLMRTSDEHRRRLGRTARSRIESDFSMDARAANWEALYHTLHVPIR